jgi:hypothetical protein
MKKLQLQNLSHIICSSFLFWTLYKQRGVVIQFHIKKFVHMGWINQKGVWGFILSHFFTLPGAWNVILGFYIWLAPSQAFCLGRKPKARVATIATKIEMCWRAPLRRLTRSQVTGWDQVEGLTKSSCGIKTW